MLLLSSSSFGFNEPLKVGVIGLSHSHVHWILANENNSPIEIVGIVEPNADLAERYAKQYNFSLGLVYKTLDAMLAEVSPEAVTAFGSIYDHLEIVEKCAPKGIHVMVEKPFNHPELLMYSDRSPHFPEIATWGLIPPWVKDEIDIQAIEELIQSLTDDELMAHTVKRLRGKAYIGNVEEIAEEHIYEELEF